MADPLKHAQRSEDEAHTRVQPYMISLFQRLAVNYLILVVAMVLVYTAGTRLLLNLFPVSLFVANGIAFAVNVLILLFGWRYLENRNRATGLFVLYTRYSRQRRDLNDTITRAEDGSLENTDRLYLEVDLLEENTNSLLEAIEEQGVKAHQMES